MDKIIILALLLIPRSYGLNFNLAFGKKVYMSSVKDNHSGYNAVDSVLFFHTYAEIGPATPQWLLMDLGRPLILSQVYVYTGVRKYGQIKYSLGVLNDFDPTNTGKDLTKQYKAFRNIDVNTGDNHSSNTVVPFKDLHFRYVILHKDPGSDFFIQEILAFGNYINYIGCYNTVENNDETATNLDLDQCIEKCENSGNIFAGIMGNKSCFCGNEIKQSRPLTECDVLCDKGVDYCGGKAVISVFKVAPALSGKRMEINYVGCFIDKLTKPEYRQRGWENDAMTLEMCHLSCIKYNTIYFAVQNGTKCSCGNSLSAYGKADENQCSTPCKGENTQICGGPTQNSVYAIKMEGEGLNFSKTYYNCKSGEVDNEGICPSKQCKDGWAGESCSRRDCDKNNGDCQQHTCMRAPAFSAVVSECVCDAGFSKSAWWSICKATGEKVEEEILPKVKKSQRNILLYLAILLAVLMCCLLSFYTLGDDSHSND